MTKPKIDDEIIAETMGAILSCSAAQVISALCQTDVALIKYAIYLCEIYGQSFVTNMTLFKPFRMILVIE